MRFFSMCALLLALSAIPALGQSSSTTAPVPPATVSNASVDYAALKETVSQQNKVLQDQVATQRAIVKQKQALLKEAQRLDAANKKMEAEKKKLEAEAGDLEKQRQTLKASQKPGDSAAGSTTTASN